MNGCSGLYLRLSLSDGDLGKDNKDESNSIENQRILLKEFVESQEDLCQECVEYVDDGYSGTNFERPAFKQMIEDAKTGKIKTVIVKDFSRFGRDYIGVGDYLEQVFPILGIRFIALNNNYDSNDYVGKTMGLDMAVSNLVNNLYSKDISKKLKSALKVKWKQGIQTGSTAPFGYRKDQKTRKWYIDPETEKIVHMIFEMAIEGRTTSQIAEHLNELKVVTPAEYNRIHNLPRIAYNRKAPENEILWNVGMIRIILQRYEYTGALVMGKRHNVAIGSKVTRKTAERDLIITKNVHPAIVTEEEFEIAKSVIRFMPKPNLRMQSGYPLRGKVRCGNCRLALSYNASGIQETLYCAHKIYAGKHSQCCADRYPVSVVQGMVWYLARKNLEVLKNVQSGMAVSDTIHKKRQNRMQEIAAEIDHLKGERIRQYEAYAEGKMDKDTYLADKNRLSDKITELQSEKISMQKKDVEKTAEQKEMDKTVSNLEKMVQGDKLTKELADALIDKVYVYDRKHIEVVFRFQDFIRKKLAEYESGEKGT